MTTDTLLPATVATAPKRRGPTNRWLWLALGAVLALMLLAGLIVHGLSSVPTLDVTIDGEPVVSGWALGDQLAGLPPLQTAGVAVGVGIALLALLVVVPMALAIAAITLVVVMLFAVGLPVLFGLATVALVLSPLLLLGWLVWKLVT